MKVSGVLCCFGPKTAKTHFRISCVPLKNTVVNNFSYDNIIRQLRTMFSARNLSFLFFRRWNLNFQPFAASYVSCLNHVAIQQ